MNDFTLEQLIELLPKRLELYEYNSKGVKKGDPIIFDLVIFGYRNTVTYSLLKYSKGIKIKQKLIEFYDGSLKDNVQKMLCYLKEQHINTGKIQSMIDNYCDHKGAYLSPKQYRIFECPHCDKTILR